MIKEWDTDQGFIVVPNSGYRVVEVLVDDMSRGSIPAVVLSHIRKDHTIHATFDIDMPPIIDSFVTDVSTGNAPLTSEFFVQAHDPDGGDIVSFQFTVTGPRGSQWSSTDGLAAHRFVLPGTYTVVVMVTDDEGSTAISELMLIIVTDGGSFHIPIPSEEHMKGTGMLEWDSLETWLANPFNSQATATILAIDEAGETITTVDMVIPGTAKAVVDEDLFADVTYSTLKVEADRHLLACTILAGPNGRATAYLNDELATMLTISHIAEEVDYWQTTAFVSNNAGPFHPTLFMEAEVAGLPAGIESRYGQFIDLNAMLPDNVDTSDAWGTFYIHAGDPFSHTNQMTGFEMFTHHGGDGAGVELTQRGYHRLYVPHIPEETDTFWTGFALVNPDIDDASVTATFYSDQGELVHETTFVLAAGTKMKGLIEDLFPEAAGTAHWATFTSDLPIQGIEIFGTYGRRNLWVQPERSRTHQRHVPHAGLRRRRMDGHCPRKSAGFLRNRST